jgi:hypothetical protein
VLVHNVIDNDHWRHLFLIYGILWGAIAAEKLHVRAARQALAATLSEVRRRIDVPLAVPRGQRPAAATR